MPSCFYYFGLEMNRRGAKTFISILIHNNQTLVVEWVMMLD